MSRLNALHNRICRDCDHLEYYDGYYCDCEEMEQGDWDKILVQGIYIPVNEDLKECRYFIPRKTCIPSDEVKECQFWCTANYYGNLEECPHGNFVQKIIDFSYKLCYNIYIKSERRNNNGAN